MTHNGWTGCSNVFIPETPRRDRRRIAAAGGEIERLDQDLAGSHRLDDRVDPEPGSGVADVGLAVVPLSQLVGESVELGLVDRFSLSFQGRHVHVEHGPGRLLGAHDGVASPRPREQESGVESLAAEGIMSRAKGMTHDESNLGHGAVADGAHKLGTAADDAAALGVAADIKAVDILNEEDG